MRKKLHKVLASGFILLFTAAASMTALAGSWNQAGERWRYIGEDGSALTSQWLNDPGSGIWYYFDADGFMEVSTFTPDGYYVGPDGAWMTWISKKPDAGNGLHGYSQDQDSAGYRSSPGGSSDAGDADGHEISSAREIVKLVNAARSDTGCRSLTANDSLMKAAAVRSEEIVEHFSHTRPDGSASYTVLDDAGIDFLVAGENIAYGQETLDEVMEAWMKSESHRENILNGEYAEIGVDCYVHNGVRYWVQIFRLN